MEDITDANYMYSKRVCKDFEIKDLDENRDLRLLADVFENFRKVCLEFFY